MARVSVGQSCANALAAYLGKQLTGDVRVLDRWPTADQKLFARAGQADARAVVSVVKVGRRVRSDAWGIWYQNLKPIGNGQATVQFLYGGLEQPMQLDVWAKNDADRDDLVAQLDDALYQGLPTTLGVPGDPVRDGILLALGFSSRPGDSDWGGFFADYWFDDAELSDAPEPIARDVFRATYFGEARTAFGSNATVPLLTNPTLALQGYQGAAPAPGQAWEKWSMTANAKPPPLLKIVRTTGSTP